MGRTIRQFILESEFYHSQGGDDDLEYEIPPEPFILVPVGEYDGKDLLLSTTILDDSYIVYDQVSNPEHNCKVALPTAATKDRGKLPKTPYNLSDIPGSGFVGEPE